MCSAPNYEDNKVKEDGTGGACSIKRRAITAFNVLVEYLKESYHLVDLRLCKRIILKLILKEAKYKQDLSHSGWVPVAGYCEHRNELSFSIMVAKFETS
jgi:hypothetical protein